MNFAFIGIILLLVHENAFSERVKLCDLTSLTFYKDRLTTSRRLSSVAQLTCTPKLRLLSYSSCYKHEPEYVQCYNRGSNGNHVQWECRADLDKRVKFSMLKVSCEGYDFTDDPYVLAGSCGLEYSLEMKPSNNLSEYYNRDYYKTNKLSNFLTLIIMIIIMCAIYKSCSKNRQGGHDMNDTFAQIIQGTDNNNIINNNNQRNPPVESLYPPPPPPYVFANISANNSITKITETNTTDVRNIHRNNTFDDLLQAPAAASQNTPTLARLSNEETREESPPPSYETAANTTVAK